MCRQEDCTCHVVDVDKWDLRFAVSEHDPASLYLPSDRGGEQRLTFAEYFARPQNDSRDVVARCIIDDHSFGHQLRAGVVAALVGAWLQGAAFIKFIPFSSGPVQNRHGTYVNEFLYCVFP